MGVFLLPNVWSLFFFLVFCYRPDDGSLKLKPVAWLRVASVCIGCDCTTDKSKYFGQKTLYNDKWLWQENISETNTCQAA
jgi:hypothetical protein